MFAVVVLGMMEELATSVWGDTTLAQRCAFMAQEVLFLLTCVGEKANIQES